MWKIFRKQLCNSSFIVNQKNCHLIETKLHTPLLSLWSKMSNFSELNLTSNTTIGSSNYYGIRGNIIVTIAINSVTCPLTVLLNALVIMAVIRRPRLQSYPNILLACLAATDVSTGLTVQPLFILWKSLELLGISYKLVKVSHDSLLRVLSICSCLHLTLVTFERLIAIKLTMRYPYFVTTKNIKVAVIAFWIFTLSSELLRLILTSTKMVFNLAAGLIVFLCVLFISSTYAILYRETLCHKKKIKNQQLPQEEVERFVKESKALKTTVFVVGAVVLCFVPMAFAALSFVTKVNIIYQASWVRTFGMLNSLFNPLIYCWRNKEMRQFVFRIKSQAVPTVAFA